MIMISSIMKYTFQIIGSKYLGDGVAFCGDMPREIERLKLKQSCSEFRNPINANSVLIGRWLKAINEGDDQMMCRMSHNISRALYDSNNHPKSVTHNVIIYKFCERTFIAEVSGAPKAISGGYDIGEGTIKSLANVYENALYFNSKSSWLYKIITTYK